MRLLTYNIHKGIGGRDRRHRLDRIMAVIARESPDLLCLQEVSRHAPRSPRQDQPRLLGGLPGIAARLFQLNVRWQVGGYGNLLLSRWPIGVHHQVPLGFADKKPRGAQIAVVETPEGRLLLVNWHLGLGEAERRWQALRLLEHRQFLESAGLPALVAGDANDWRNTLAGGPFARHGFAQATAPPWRFRSFPAFLPLGALDKVFYRGALRISRVRVVQSALARDASDHLPVVVDFHLRHPGGR